MGIIRQAAKRAGRRGGFLAFLVVLDTIIWWSLLHEGGDREHTVLVDPHLWAWIWLAAAVVCAAGVLTRRDRISYGVAAAVKSWWGLRYIHIWLVQGVSDAWELAAIWLTFAAAVLLISSWPEPTVIVEKQGQEDDR